MNIWFAIDNIDLLEDTPTGQGTFHGTVVVINQQAVDGEPVNQPLVIPEKLSSQDLLAFEMNVFPEPDIRTSPLRFQAYKKRKQNLISQEFTHTWALVNYLTTDDNGEIIRTEPQLHDEEAQRSEEMPSDAESTNYEETEPSSNKEEAGSSKDREETNSVVIIKKQVKKSDKLAKNDVLPTWAATRSLLLSQSSPASTPTNTAVVAPLFKTSPTDYGTLYTVLRLSQGISATVVGPHRKTLITLDLDLYSRALKIQQSVGNANWILRAGALHIAFAALHALGKTIDGSGLDTCAIECGAYTSASLRRIFGGKAYKRGLEFHITASLAIMMLRFDAILSDLPKGPIRIQCNSLKEKLHGRDPEMVEIYEEIQSWYSSNVKPLEEAEDLGEFAQFLTRYLNQVESLLHLISSCRSGDWEGYLSSLEDLTKYFFARDLLNYARLMPVHLAQMNALE